MMDKLKSLKVKKGNLAEVDQDARTAVLQSMREKAANSMGEKLKGLKKVSVASDSKPGLAEGLEKAKEMLEGESLEHEMSESPEVEAIEEELDQKPDSELSEEELDAKIAELVALKQQKMC